MAGLLERGFAFGAGFGATMAGVSFAFDSAASSLVAASPELRESPAEEEMAAG